MITAKNLINLLKKFSVNTQIEILRSLLLTDDPEIKSVSKDLCDYAESLKLLSDSEKHATSNTVLDIISTRDKTIFPQWFNAFLPLFIDTRLSISNYCQIRVCQDTVSESEFNNNLNKTKSVPDYAKTWKEDRPYNGSWIYKNRFYYKSSKLNPETQNYYASKLLSTTALTEAKKYFKTQDQAYVYAPFVFATNIKRELMRLFSQSGLMKKYTLSELKDLI